MEEVLRACERQRKREGEAEATKVRRRCRGEVAALTQRLGGGALALRSLSLLRRRFACV